MYLEELGAYKETAIAKLIARQPVIELLLGETERTEATDEELLKHHVFPFLYQPDPQDTMRRYVCLETNVVEVSNAIVKTMRLDVFVFCHKDLVRMPDGLPYKGTTIDALCNQVDLLFNGTRDLGIGKVLTQPTELIRPADNYYGRVIQYIVSEFNRPRN